MADCLDDETVLAFVEQRLDAEAVHQVDLHLDVCAACRALLVALLRTGSASGSGPPPVEQPILPRGTTVGRYTLRDPVGAGGMGIVYAARDPELDRLVAIKLVRPGGAETATDGARDRVLREAQAMARLAHPNVISVYDVGTFGGGVFVAMELVEGKTLRDAARELRSADPGGAWREILRLFAAAGEGLAAAHAVGIVHRDFKQENVLVGADGRVRVCDFGLARAIAESSGEVAIAESADATGLLSPLTRAGTLVGTPAYMSPEQLDGGRGDARSDLFAFCVALYEGVYGERPFDGRTVADLRAAILARRVRPAPAGSRVPAWLRAWLLRGMDPDPSARPHTMREALDGLRPPRRGWRAVLVVAIGLGTTIVIVVGLLPLGRQTATFSPRAQRRLTNDTGCQEYPSFTPDGRGILFDATVGDDDRLFLLDLATGARRGLLDVEGRGYAPVVSRDGRDIAFVRVEPAGGATGAGGSVALIAPLDGSSSPRRIAAGWIRPSFSPDDRAVWAGLHEAVRYDRVTLAPTRKITPPEGEDVNNVVELRDGRVVVRTFSAAGSQGILLYPRDGGAPKVLLAERTDEVLAVDAQEEAVFVARTAVGPGASALVRVPFDGSVATEVSGGIQPTKGLVVAPSRDRAVWSTCNAHSQLVALSSDGAGALQRLPIVSTQNDWTDEAPQTLPGGGFVVATNRSGPFEIWRMRSDGGGAAQIPTGAVVPTPHLAVSPDGRSIAFAPEEAGVYIVPVDGTSSPRRVAETGRSPSFRRDGRALFVVVGGPASAALDLVPLDGGPVERLAQDVGPAARGSLARDEVFYLRGGKLVRLDLLTREEHEIEIELIGAAASIAVASDGDHVAVSSSIMVVEVDLAAGSVVGRLRAAHGTFRGVTYGAHGLIAATRTWIGNLWVAEGRFP